MSSKKVLNDDDKADKIFSVLGGVNQCLTKLIMKIKNEIDLEYLAVVCLALNNPNHKLKPSVVRSDLAKLSLEACQDGEPNYESKTSSARSDFKNSPLQDYKLDHELKQLLVRSDFEKLSRQACQDGELKVNNSLFSAKGPHVCAELSSKVTEIKQIYEFLKFNSKMKALLILISCDNHEQFTMDYKLLEASEAAQLASTCKQPLIPYGKSACFIIAGTKKQLDAHLHWLSQREREIKQHSKATLVLKETDSSVTYVDPDPVKGHKLKLDDLEDRIKTFTLPPQWDGPVDYQSMAEAGFVYTGQEDLVYCFSCKIKLDRWSKHMEPLLRHKEESPTCSFMRQKLRAVKGEKGKTKSVVAPSKPLNARLTSSIGQLQSSSLVTSKNIHTVVTGLNESRLSYGGSYDDRRGASLPITPENYQSEEERIKSFVGWPLNEAVHPEQLARVGFVYTGEGALVQCFQCGVKYRHWYKGDVPLNVHQKCNPRCPFLQTFVSDSIFSRPERQPALSYVPPESIGSNTQVEEVTLLSLQLPDYSKETIRLQSFKHWGGVLPAQELAEGGFYMIARRDVVRCFSCNVVVQDWERTDNVIDEHHKYSPNCSFIKAFVSSRACTGIESFPALSAFGRSSHHSLEQPVDASKVRTENNKTLQLPSGINASNVDTIPITNSIKSNDEGEAPAGIRYPPSWGQYRSMSPQGASNKIPEGSDDSFHSAESHHVTNDYNILSSINPPKTKIVYEESLSAGVENNISIKTNDSKGDVTGSPALGICQICYDKNIDCIFLPCGHARTCESCATRIKNAGQPCPYCRKGVSTTYRIYL